MNSLGQELKKLRSIKQLNQSDAAKHIGIEQSYLSKLESDQSWASIEILRKVCAVYGVRPAQLLSQVSSESLQGNIQYQGLLIRAKHRRNILVFVFCISCLVFTVWLLAVNSWIKLPGLQPISPNHAPITLSLDQIPANEALEILASFAHLEVVGSELLTQKDISINIDNQPWDKALTQFVEEQGLKVRIEGGKIIIAE